MPGVWRSFVLTDVLLAYVHHIAAFALVAILFVEMALCKPGMSPAQMRTLTRYDAFYGVFAAILLVVGTMRVFWGVKGAQFYSSNPVFHTKITLFLLIGLLSVPPTLRYLRWSKALKANALFTPDAAEIKATRRFIHIQAALIIVLPLLAALMARGVGIPGR
jgi:putative membrane protein